MVGLNGKLTGWVGRTVTHRGEPQTFASALPTLMRLQRAKSPAAHRAICGCHGQPRFHEPAAPAREIADLDWSVCPLDLLDSPFSRQVAALHGLARRGVQPHQELVAWAVIGLLATPE